MSNSVRQLMNNLGTIILALLLAFVIWISATLQNDPFTDQVFPNVPITVINQPENTEFVEPIADQVAITARARQSVLADLAVADLEAVMDLSGLESGTLALVPIQIACQNEAVRIQSWDPETQKVSLEAVRTLTLPVEIEAQGEVGTGYRASRAVVRPDQVVVTGTESLLSQVVAVSGSLNVEGARGNISEQVVVKPVDADGRPVPNLQWAPERVDVQIELRRKIGFKPDLEVVPDLRGEPAPDYRLGSVSIEPSTVTLAGLPSVLEELPGFVETWPISVTGATKDLIEYSPLKVPEGVAVVGFDYVTVVVEVLPIESSRAMTSAVETQGVQPGLMATPSPNVVDVILAGPNTILSALTTDDIRVILNLFGYAVGVHRIEPDIVAPEGVIVVSIIPETIEVVIGPAPTPIPTLTVTVTVTAEP